jgi:hypothetical protein
MLPQGMTIPSPVDVLQPNINLLHSIVEQVGRAFMVGISLFNDTPSTTWRQMIRQLSDTFQKQLKEIAMGYFKTL